MGSLKVEVRKNTSHSAFSTGIPRIGGGLGGSSISWPTNPDGCTYGGGYCGGGAYGFRLGTGLMYRPPNLTNIEFLSWILQIARANMSSAGKQLTDRANQLFNQCISSQGFSRMGVAAFDTVHDAAKASEAPSSNGLLLNATGEVLDLHKECLGGNPGADLSPNYRGLFHIGDL